MMGFLLSREGGPPARWKLIAPFLVLAVLVAGYTAYWMYAAGEVRRWAVNWIAEQEADGYEIAHGRMRVSGYPLRFTLDVVDPEIEAPASEGGWMAQFDRLSASAMPWNFNHWIVSIGGPLMLAVETGQGPGLYRGDAESAQLSLSTSSSGTQRIGIELESLVLDAIEGPQPAITALERFVLSGDLDDEDRMAARLDAEGVSFARALVDAELGEVFGTNTDLARFDGAITQWSALARSGDAAAWARAGGALTIGRSQLNWGPARLGGTGELTLDRTLRPAGRLSVVISDPDTLVEAMVEAGLVQTGQGDALRLAAMMAPRREGGIALPLRFQDGGIFLGPARIGSVGAVD